MSQAGQRKRTPRTAEVVRATWLTRSLRRVVFTGPDLRCLQEMPYTDHYLKILFAPHGCDYRWPFDPDELKAVEPAERWPVTRTYTVRSYDAARNEMSIDFVVHGDEGLAGPWAAAAVPGDQIGFFGPGGGYAPDPTADDHLLVGDESAIPAIAAALDRLGPQARAAVYLEVAGPGDELALSASPDVRVTWVHRQGSPYGERAGGGRPPRRRPGGRRAGLRARQRRDDPAAAPLPVRRARLQPPPGLDVRVLADGPDRGRLAGRQARVQRPARGRGAPGRRRLRRPSGQ